MASPFEDLFVAAMDATLIAGPFGESITHTPRQGESYTLKGMVRTGVQLESLVPGNYLSIRVRLADLPTFPQQNDRFTVRSVEYRAVEIEADTSVSVTVILQRFNA